MRAPCPIPLPRDGRPRSKRDARATRIRTEILPLTDTAEQGGTRFPTVVAELSADIYTYAAEWLTRLEAELEAELPEPDVHSRSGGDGAGL